MALTLKDAITATQTTIDVNGTDALSNGDLYAIEDEQVFIVTASAGSIQPGETAWQRLGVQRGSLGTTEVAHAAGTAMTEVETPLGPGGAPLVFLSTTVVLDRAAIRAMHGTAQQILAPTESPAYASTPTEVPLVSWASAVLSTDGTDFGNVPNPANLLLVWGADWSLTIAKVLDGATADVADVHQNFDAGAVAGRADWLPFASLSFDAPFSFRNAFADNGVYLLLVGDGGGGDTTGPLTGGGANASLTVRIQYTVIDL